MLYHFQYITKTVITNFRKLQWCKYIMNKVILDACLNHILDDNKDIIGDDSHLYTKRHLIQNMNILELLEK